MKVLLTSSLYPTPEAPRLVGGAEIFARRFAENLLKNGDSVEVIRAASRPDQAPEECNGVNIHSAPVQNIYLPFAEPRNPAIRGLWHAIDDWQGAAPLVAERIRAFKPDVLHSNNLSGLTTAIWKASAEHGIPVIHTLHDYYLVCPRCSRFARGHSCKHTCMSCGLLTVNRQRATRWLNAVVGVSQRVLDIHVELGLFADTPLRTVILNASTAALTPHPHTGPDTEVTFGFIGRLTVEKGIDNLVQAWAAVPRDHARLLIAGHASDQEQQRLKAMAPDARIEFLGFVAPDEFYRQIDVVIAPSIWEDPGPLVVADANAAGKPILGTHFGGMPEVVKHGVTGWLTAADPQSLTRSILEIAANPKQIADISRRLASNTSKWTFADVVCEYRKLYERLRDHGG
jgi:glycosyltransferase involved in cell wall biosynthesis